jgi:hypothetical protein
VTQTHGIEVWPACAWPEDGELAEG